MTAALPCLSACYNRRLAFLAIPGTPGSHRWVDSDFTYLALVFPSHSAWQAEDSVRSRVNRDSAVDAARAHVLSSPPCAVNQWLSARLGDEGGVNECPVTSTPRRGDTAPSRARR